MLYFSILVLVSCLVLLLGATGCRKQDDDDDVIIGSSATADTWTLLATTNVPEPRVDHTAVWTGTEMIIWGGSNTSGTLNTGGRYDPSLNTWTPTITTSAPSAMSGHTAVWTGYEMIVWGNGQGARYNPTLDSWQAITSGGGSIQADTAVWTGYEMIVWGSGQGARYNPFLDTWQTITTVNAPSSRRYYSAVWTGTELVVWGGVLNVGSQPLNTGACYNPTLDAWRPISTTGAPAGRWLHATVWIPTASGQAGAMIIWGGCGGIHEEFALNTGLCYDPILDTWTAITTTNAPSARTRHRAVWTGTEMFIWGGRNTWSEGLNTGARYNPSTDTWTNATTTGTPSGRAQPSIIWTGAKTILWGGSAGENQYYQTGAIYDYPHTIPYWTATPLAGTPAARRYHTAIWAVTTATPTGELIIWGGEDGSSSLDDGKRYRPGINNWALISTTNAPSARWGHTAVWTGDPAAGGTGEMIIWGGFQGGTYDVPLNPLNTGARYDPVLDAWTPIADVDPWQTFTVDSTGDVGQYTSLALGTDNKAHISYYAGDNNRLKYATILLEIPWTMTTESPDSGDVGMHSSIILDSANTTYISYYYAGTADLKCVTGTAGSWATPATVDSSAGVGQYTSIDLDSNKKKYISYYDSVSGGGSLKHATDASGSWVTTTVDDNAQVGQYTSLALVDADKKSHISYYDELNGDLKYATIAFGSVVSQTINSGPAPFNVGQHTSIALDADKKVYISYYNVTSGSLECIMGTPGSWVIETVDNSANVGQYTSIALDVDKNVYISYYDVDNGNLKYATNDSGAWVTTTIDSSGDVGKYTSIAVDANKKVHISYYDASNGNLKYATNPDILQARGYHTAVWTGTEMIIWGGLSQTGVTRTALDTGARYNPILDDWVTIIMTSAPVSRYGHTAIWTGTRMIIWGGRIEDQFTSRDSGAQYDPISDTWTATSLSNVPYSRYDHTAVWTGKEMIIWGGYRSGSMFDTGSRYDPIANTWTTLSFDAPEGRKYHTAVWTGTEMIIWGGDNVSMKLNTGARYLPVADIWLTRSTTDVPDERGNHTATWAGSEMIIWGGLGSYQYLNSGGRYKPR